MTGWILEPSYPPSRTPKFQCLLLEDGETPEWCEGERLMCAGGSWTPSIGQGGESSYLENLCRELDMDAATVRRRAAEVRSKILHDYSRFTVLTIGRFSNGHSFISTSVNEIQWEKQPSPIDSSF